jgi:CheY-like chemotaxis protein
MGDVARLLVQDGTLSAEDAARAVKAARGGDVASAALELRLADESTLARALALARECPAIDLSRSVVPLGNLDAITPDFCREHRVLPVAVGRIEVVLAMADPDDLTAADEVRFVTGKRVLRHAAVGTAIVRAIDGLERARREGAPAWRGERAPVLPEPSSGHAAVVRPGERTGSVELPEATESMEIVGIADMLPFEMDRSAPPSLQRAAAGPAARGAAPAPASPPAPRAAAGNARPAPAAVAPDLRATVRLEGMAVGKVVLVADDDPQVGQLLGAVLQRMGCVVLQAPDGTTALQMVREAMPDLVVLDAMMPGLHGFEVCRMIKGDRALRSTRVVLCSAIYRGTVGVDAQVAFGADAFVEKPFRIDELTRVFKVALVGPVAAETAEERVAREEANQLWRAASDALAAERLPEAADLARQAAAKDPWSAEAHYYLGHALSKQGMLYEAVAAYERSAELRPDVDASHQCLAQVYEKLGFQKSAREAWGRAIETCKDPSRKRAMQARLMKMLGA